MVPNLASRIGPQVEGALIPLAVLVIHVPIMWAAAALLGAPPVVFREGRVDADGPVLVGWTALEDMFRTWEITARVQQSGCGGRGFVVPQQGNHISSRARVHSDRISTNRRQGGVVGSHVRCSGFLCGPCNDTHWSSSAARYRASEARWTEETFQLLQEGALGSRPYVKR